MSRFIEEFYYGNIDPQARSIKENKAVQKQMEILMNNEDLLTNTLTDKPKKWFLDYVNAWGVVNGESNLDSECNFTVSYPQYHFRIFWICMSFYLCHIAVC